MANVRRLSARRLFGRLELGIVRVHSRGDHFRAKLRDNPRDAFEQASVFETCGLYNDVRLDLCHRDGRLAAV